MKQLEESRIYYLISTFLTKGLTKEEESELKVLLQESSNKEYFQQLYSIDLIARNTKRYRDLDPVFEGIIARINEDSETDVEPKIRRIKHNFTWRSIAASIIFLIAFGIGMYYLGEKNINDTIMADNNASTIQVPLGSQSTISLPDGSIVTLNSGSTIRYSNSFGKKDRELQLEGEAFFEVFRNEEKPFIVYAKKSAIEVLGTTFNVKAYGDEDFLETTLVEGSVRVTPDINDISRKKIVLSPNQAILINLKNNGLQISLRQNINTLLYTSWKDPRWIIQGEQMESLARKLERRYSVSIKVDDELRKYKFSGTLVDETLQQTLDIMKSIAPITYTLNKKTVFISVDSKRRSAFEQSITKNEK